MASKIAQSQSQYGQQTPPASVDQDQRVRKQQNAPEAQSETSLRHPSQDQQNNEENGVEGEGDDEEGAEAEADGEEETAGREEEGIEGGNDETAGNEDQEPEEADIDELSVAGNPQQTLDVHPSGHRQFPDDPHHAKLMSHYHEIAEHGLTDDHLHSLVHIGSFIMATLARHSGMTEGYEDNKAGSTSGKPTKGKPSLGAK